MMTSHGGGLVRWCQSNGFLRCQRTTKSLLLAVHSAMGYTPIGALSPASAKVQRDKATTRQQRHNAIKKAAGQNVLSGMTAEAHTRTSCPHSHQVQQVLTLCSTDHLPWAQHQQLTAQLQQQGAL